MWRKQLHSYDKDPHSTEYDDLENTSDRDSHLENWLFIIQPDWYNKIDLSVL